MSRDPLWAPWCLKKPPCLHLKIVVIFVSAVLSRGHAPKAQALLGLRPNPVPMYWSTLETRGFLCCSGRHTGGASHNNKANRYQH